MSQVGNAILHQNRYRELYRLSRALRSTSSVIRITAAMVAVVMPVSSAWFFTQSEPYSSRLGWSVLGTGLCVGAGGYVLALILSAVGHLTRAAADTAVSASPLISTEMKSVLLSRAIEEENETPFRVDIHACAPAAPAPESLPAKAWLPRLKLMRRQLPTPTEPAA